MRWKTAALLLLVLSASALAAPKVETTGPCTDAAVADAVRKALAPQGYRVILDDGSTVDLWPPAQIQSSAKTREDADRKSTRLNSSHGYISYAVFCLKKKKHNT